MKIVRLLLAALAVFSSGVLSAESFTLESKGNGAWSDAATWKPARQPKAGDKVHIRSGHAIIYDVKSPHLIPLLHIEGALVFARGRDTELN
ncbi:MAG: G8 domain-containing protein, partial [Akkermansiaceae bacterium]